MRQLVPIMVTILALALTLYLLWADSRVMRLYDEPPVHVGPHPDRWLDMLYDWYDARHPISAEGFKMHGEIPRVGATIRTMLAISGMLSGFVVAIFWPRSQVPSGKRMPLLAQFSLRSLMVAIAVVTFLCWVTPRIWQRPWGFPFRTWDGWALAILAAGTGAMTGRILTKQPTASKPKA